VSGVRYVARSPEIAARLFDGEMMIMSARDSAIFTLSEVATVIWEAADGSTPLDEIVATRVCVQFDVAPEVALEDAEHLVQALAGHGLLVISDQPIGLAGSPEKETT
jgi:predicted alternative tryptophan synthase beta-subunit